jgi:hypothetical protein
MNQPSIKETAFNCPHCGAFTTQYWHDGYVQFIREDPKVPSIPNAEMESFINNDRTLEPEIKQAHLEWVRKMRAKLLFTSGKSDYKSIPALNNLFLSQCYNCKKWSVWVSEDLVYPPKKFGALPNQDLPEEIFAMVEEARSILDNSPKGAAALLRLAIQMLCKHLGETGDNLNADIANLVKKGLNPIVAKSLDVVRVIGNESVHPGSINLNDDKDIAVRIFDLVNIIADQMITHPKQVDELFNKLPESKRTAIENRNKMAIESDD